MGEWTGVTVKFGGKLKREAVAGLLTVLEHHSLRTEMGEHDPSAANLNETFKGEANYGQIEEVIQYCEIVGIDYEHVISGSSAFDGTVSRRVGSTTQAMAYSEDGEPMIPLKLVLEIETLMQGMANLINIARFWAKPLVLEIIP